MAATATHMEVMKCHVPLAALAAVTVAALVVATLLGTVEMLHIMVRVPVVAAIILMAVVMKRSATPAAAIKA